jgi:hypothetical protein
MFATIQDPNLHDVSANLPVLTVVFPPVDGEPGGTNDRSADS